MNMFNEWLENKNPTPELPISESSSSRYSIEVNYRTSIGEAIEAFAKLTLGYIGAALKNCGFHIKTIYDKKPYRIIISTRNWDNGEWVGVVMFDEKDNCFTICKGHYSKEKKTVTLTGSHKSTGKSAAEIAKEMRNYVEKLKHENPHGSDTLNPAPMRRGPKPKFMQKIHKAGSPWKGYDPY